MPPEVVEMLVAFLLFNAVDNIGWIVGDLHEILKLNKVHSEDKYSVEWVC
jgi:hypothetical protein